MPGTDVQRFGYVAIDASGARLEGVDYAADERSLDRKLAAAGSVLLRARPLSSQRGRVRGRVLIDVFYHLSIAVSGGVPILQALRDLQEEGRHPLARELSAVESAVRSGATLSDAFAAHPRHFSPLAVSLVRAGERTGKLATVLEDLVRHLEWREDLRRKVRQATTYPAIVSVALIGLCAILVLFVLPRFAAIFEDVGVELPVTMRAMLATRDFLALHWLASAVSLAGVLIALAYALRTAPGRELLDRAALRVPVVRSVLPILDAARLAHNLALLYAAGLALLDSLALVRAIVQNRVLKRLVGEAETRLRGGGGLSESLAASGLLPTLVIRMLQVGESTGRLDAALERVSDYYDRELPMVIDRTLALFNVGVMVTLAGFLVAVTLSFFMPLYQMMGNLSHG
ncbi:MAG: type II secretion system F family protein [Myxococcota bacterium]